MKMARFIPIFSAAYGPLYVVAMYFNLPVFSYVAQTHQFHPLRFIPPVRQQIGMYYWGWLLTAAIGAAIIAAVASFVPQKIAARISVAWVPVFPVCCIVVLLYILRSWFMQG